MLDGKRIVVTGVSSGIGAETAAELKRQGATIIGAHRRLGNATMHGLGFLGLQIATEGFKDIFWMVFTLWGAENWIYIDGEPSKKKFWISSMG